MSNHTPEPWVSDGSKVEGDCPAYRQDIAYCPTFLHNQTYGEANAARIVACVNALRGLDIEKVEALLDVIRAAGAHPDGVIVDGAYIDRWDEHGEALWVHVNALADSIRAGGGE